MTDRAALPGRPGPGIYASGGVASPRFRPGLVGEGASGYPAPFVQTQEIGPLRATDPTAPIRTVTIHTTQRGNQ